MCMGIGMGVELTARGDVTAGHTHTLDARACWLSFEWRMLARGVRREQLSSWSGGVFRGISMQTLSSSLALCDAILFIMSLAHLSSGERSSEAPPQHTSDIFCRRSTSQMLYRRRSTSEPGCVCLCVSASASSAARAICGWPAGAMGESDHRGVTSLSCARTTPSLRPHARNILVL